MKKILCAAALVAFIATGCGDNHAADMRIQYIKDYDSCMDRAARNNIGWDLADAYTACSDYYAPKIKFSKDD